MKIYPIKPPEWLCTIGRGLGYVLLSPLLLHLWLERKYDERFGGKYGEWQRWYAWWPTRLGWYDSSQGWVWLEPVERTRYSSSTWTCYLYRRPGDETVIAEWDRIDPEEG